MTTPSPSSRSADPHFDVTERLPCLATRTPAPAMTKAAVVEMLNVPRRLLPCRRCQPRTLRRDRRRGSAAASPTRSQQSLPPSHRACAARSPARQSEAGVTAPVMIWFMAAAAPVGIQRPAFDDGLNGALDDMIVAHEPNLPGASRSCRDGQLSHRRSPPQEVGEQIVAVRGQNRFWVELTPSTGIVRCRRPMTRPSASAVISGSDGRVERSTINE